jgi:hypothetical protein
LRDSELLNGLAHRLANRQNADGGWPASESGESATEPTAWALRALVAAGTAGSNGGATTRSREGAVGWLVERQSPEGSWPISDRVPERGASTSLAALALAATGDELLLQRSATAAEWLLEHPGKQVSWRTRLWLRWNPERNPLEMDLAVRGWPWMEGMWGWIEPTSTALLLFHRLRDRLDGSRVTAAIADGEAMLLDRTCPGGGWNHGLGRSHDEDLWPYPDTTAFALLALGPGRPEPAIREGLAALELMLRAPVSRLASALGILVADAFATDPGVLPARLRRQWAEEYPEPTTRAMAVSLLAAAGEPLARPSAAVPGEARAPRD